MPLLYTTQYAINTMRFENIRRNSFQRRNAIKKFVSLSRAQ